MGRGTQERRLDLTLYILSLYFSLITKKTLLIAKNKKNKKKKEFGTSSPSKKTSPKLNFRSRKSSWKSGMGNQPQSKCDICSPSFGAQGGVWGIKVLTNKSPS